MVDQEKLTTIKRKTCTINQSRERVKKKWVLTNWWSVCEEEEFEGGRGGLEDLHDDETEHFARKPHLQTLGPLTEAKPATTMRGTMNKKNFIVEHVPEQQCFHRLLLLPPIVLTLSAMVLQSWDKDKSIYSTFNKNFWAWVHTFHSWYSWMPEFLYLRLHFMVAEIHACRGFVLSLFVNKAEERERKVRKHRIQNSKCVGWILRCVL